MVPLDWRQPLRLTSILRCDNQRYLAPVLTMATVKVIGIIALAVWSAFNEKNAHVLLSARWDSLWYVRVVEHGYDFSLTANDGRILSDMAFFPLFPALECILSSLLFVSPADAGLLISGVSSLFAAAGIYAVVGQFADRRVAILVVVLWATLPVSIVQSMAYSESLFTALSAWALYFALKGNWLFAGMLACCAGLTRPVGIAVTLALWMAVAADVRRDGWSILKFVGSAMAPLGFIGYLLWVAKERDSLYGYLEVQGAWGNGFDGGISFAEFIYSLSSAPPFVGGILLCGGVGLAIWAYILGFSRKCPLPLQVYSGIVVLLALGSSGFFGSKPRLLVPAFGLLVPLASHLLRKKNWVRVSVLAVMFVVSAAYGAFWLNGSGPP